MSAEDVVMRLRLVYSRTPPPLRPYREGAACPWCAECHETITFGINICEECGKSFIFGFPPWENDNIALSWVNLRYEEENLLIKNPDLMPVFEPNERLKKLYKAYEMYDDFAKATHYHETVQ